MGAKTLRQNPDYAAAIIMAAVGIITSPDRCSTSVGTRTLERIDLTSIIAFIETNAL